MEKTFVEYRIRKVTRYALTEYTGTGLPGSSGRSHKIAEFDNEHTAGIVRKALQACLRDEAWVLAELDAGHPVLEQRIHVASQIRHPDAHRISRCLLSWSVDPIVPV